MLERANDFGQRVDITANEAIACFHALNGGHGELCSLRQNYLIDPKKCPRSAKLWRGYHVSAITMYISIVTIYAISIHAASSTMSSLSCTCRCMIALLRAKADGLWTRAHIRNNVLAGVVVGVVALPLAMAFAIASGA